MSKEIFENENEVLDFMNECFDFEQGFKVTYNNIINNGYVKKSELEQRREDYNTYMMNHPDPPTAVLLYVKALREEVTK